MARIARMVVKDEPAVYHVMSRTALDGFALGDLEKEYLLELIKKLSTKCGPKDFLCENLGLVPFSTF